MADDKKVIPITEEKTEEDQTKSGLELITLIATGMMAERGIEDDAKRRNMFWLDFMLTARNASIEQCEPKDVAERHDYHVLMGKLMDLLVPEMANNPGVVLSAGNALHNLFIALDNVDKIADENV